MPIPTPTPNEKREDFMARCMSDSKMLTEYTEANQRYAVCIASYKEAKS